MPTLTPEDSIREAVQSLSGQPLLELSSQLRLEPGEASAAVASLHERLLATLKQGQLAPAQELAAELLELLDATREAIRPKTRTLVEFVVLVS